MEMNDARKKILEMLADNKINTDDAERLLNAVEKDREPERSRPSEPGINRDPERNSSAGPGVTTSPKYLRVTIVPDPEHCDSHHADRVNVRIPMSLIRAGIKLKSLVPPEAMDKVNGALRDKGIDFDFRSFKAEDIEELIGALGEMQIDIEGHHGEKVRVFVE
jgi:hypothetical protein